MKSKNESYSMLLEMDGSIKFSNNKNFKMSEIKYVEYILLANIDGLSHMICTPNEFLDMKSCNISYQMVHYLYDEFPELDEESSDIYESENCRILNDRDAIDIVNLEVHNAIELYSCIWNVLNLYMVNNLISNQLDPDYYSALTLTSLSISGETNDGIVIDFNWKYKGKNTASDELNELCKILMKMFAIPKDMRHLSDVFVISKNQWKLKSIYKVKDNALIGVISNINMNVYFTNYFDLDFTECSIFEVNFITYESKEIIPYLPNRDMSLEEFSTHMVDIIENNEPFYVSFDEFMPYTFNEKASIILNIHYLFRYMECVSMAIVGEPAENLLVVCHISARGEGFGRDIAFTKNNIPSPEWVTDHTRSLQIKGD